MESELLTFIIGLCCGFILSSIGFHWLLNTKMEVEEA